MVNNPVLVLMKTTMHPPAAGRSSTQPADEPLPQALTAAVIEHYGTAEPDKVGRA